MEVPPRVDRLLAKAVDEQVSEQRLLREALEDVAARLERVETTTAALAEKIEPWSDPGAATADLAVRVEKRIGKRFDELAMALDDMAVTIENRAVDAMSEDLDAVADELRKAVTELARLLVRDRTRINRTLTEHRNAIVAELRLPASNGHTVDLRRDDDEGDDDVDDEPDVVAAGGARRLLRRLRCADVTSPGRGSRRSPGTGRASPGSRAVSFSETCEWTMATGGAIRR